MEKLIVGKWHYTEIRDTNYNMSSNGTYEKTDFTNQQDLYYLEFKSDFNSTIPNTNHHAKYVNGSLVVGGSTHATTIWYYDEVINKLNFYGGSASPFIYDVQVNGNYMSMRLDYKNSGVVYTCKLKKQ